MAAAASDVAVKEIGSVFTGLLGALFPRKTGVEAGGFVINDKSWLEMAADRR